MLRKNISASLSFTVLSIAASVLNFIYYPVVARHLSLASFGDVQLGVSFIMQAAALFTSLNIVALYITATSTNGQHMMSRLERLIIAPSVGLAVIVAVFAGPISSSLHLSDASLLYILSIIFIVNIPSSTWLGSLQGQGLFIQSGMIAVASSLTKIIVSVVLILLGLGAHGAILGILCGSLIIIPLAFFAQKTKTLHIKNSFTFPNKDDVKSLASHPTMGWLLVAFLIYATIGTLDVIVAKIIAEPHAAGLYAQLSTLAKIPYFALTPISIICFQMMLRSETRHRIIIRTFFITAITLALIAIVLNPLAMLLFFGHAPGSYSQTSLIYLTSAFTGYSLSMLLTYSLVSEHYVKEALAASVIALLITCIAVLYASSTGSLAQLYFVSQAIILLLVATIRYTKYHEIS